MRPVVRLSVLIALSFCAFAYTWSQSRPDPLMQGFENPPNSARPRVWWHRMNGNNSSSLARAQGVARGWRR